MLSLREQRAEVAFFFYFSHGDAPQVCGKGVPGLVNSNFKLKIPDDDFLGNSPGTQRTQIFVLCGAFRALHTE